MDEFLVHANPQHQQTFPFLVLGNKTDLPASKRQVTQQKAKSWCASKGDLPHFETSAKESINVEQAFNVIAEKALAREQANKPIFIPDTLNLNRPQPPQRQAGGCCSS